MGVAGLNAANLFLEALVDLRVYCSHIHSLDQLFEDHIRELIRQAGLLGGWLFRRPRRGGLPRV